MICRRCANGKHHKCKGCDCQHRSQTSHQNRPTLRLITKEEPAEKTTSHQSNVSSLHGMARVLIEPDRVNLNRMSCSDALLESILRQIPICTHSICWISFLMWAVETREHFTSDSHLDTTVTWCFDRCIQKHCPAFTKRAVHTLTALASVSISFNTDQESGSA